MLNQLSCLAKRWLPLFNKRKSTYGGVLKWRYPNSWMVYQKIPLKWMIWGVSLFQETTIYLFRMNLFRMNLLYFPSLECEWNARIWVAVDDNFLGLKKAWKRNLLTGWFIQFTSEPTPKCRLHTLTYPLKPASLMRHDHSPVANTLLCNEDVTWCKQRLWSSIVANGSS